MVTPVAPEPAVIKARLAVSANRGGMCSVVAAITILLYMGSIAGMVMMVLSRAMVMMEVSWTSE